MLYNKAHLPLLIRNSPTGTPDNVVYFIPKAVVRLGNIVAENSFTGNSWKLNNAYGIIRVTIPDVNLDGIIDAKSPAVIFTPKHIGEIVNIYKWNPNKECYWKHVTLDEVVDIDKIDDNYITLRNVASFSTPLVPDVLTNILSKQIIDSHISRLFLKIVNDKQNTSNLEVTLHLPAVEDPRFYTERGGWLIPDTQISKVSKSLEELDKIPEAKLDRETIDEIEISKLYVAASKRSKDRDIVATKLALGDIYDNANLRVFDNIGRYSSTILWVGLDKVTNELKIVDTLTQVGPNVGRYYFTDDSIELIAAIPLDITGFHEIHIFTTDEAKLNLILNDKAEFININTEDINRDILGNGKFQIVIIDGSQTSTFCSGKPKEDKDNERYVNMFTAFHEMYVDAFVEGCLNDCDDAW